MTDRVVVVRQPTLVTVAAPGPQGPPGPQGAQGPPGSAGVITLTAGQTLSGHRLVTRQPDGTAAYADNATAGHLHAPLWLTLGAATSGAEVTVQSQGIVTEGSWSWIPGPIYLGTDGLLTQAPPTAVGGAAFLVQVGAATSATSITLSRSPSISLI